MNKVIITARTTADVKTTYTQSAEPMCIARVGLAIARRKRKGSNEDPGADFVNGVCFGNSAEALGKYVKKGQKLAIMGHIQTGSYTNKEGAKVYTTDIVIDEWEFAESSKSEAPTEAPQQAAAPTDADGFMNIPDDIDEELPFA